MHRVSRKKHASREGEARGSSACRHDVCITGSESTQCFYSITTELQQCKGLHADAAMNANHQTAVRHHTGVGDMTCSLCCSSNTCVCVEVFGGNHRIVAEIASRHKLGFWQKVIRRHTPRHASRCARVARMQSMPLRSTAAAIYNRTMDMRLEPLRRTSKINCNLQLTPPQRLLSPKTPCPPSHPLTHVFWKVFFSLSLSRPRRRRLRGERTHGRRSSSQLVPCVT